MSIEEGAGPQSDQRRLKATWWSSVDSLVRTCAESGVSPADIVRYWYAHGEVSGEELETILVTIAPPGVADFSWYSGRIPAGIALDRDGNLYVAEEKNDSVSMYSPDGTRIREWGGPGSDSWIDSPRSVAVTDAGSVIIANGDFNDICITRDFGWETRVGECGRDPFRFSELAAVARDPNGDIWVADQGSNRIFKIGSDSHSNNGYRCLGKWGAPGPGPMEFNRPCGIAVGRNGRVYVVDRGNCRIQILTLSGEFVGFIGRGGLDPMKLLDPRAVAIDGSDRIYVADVDHVLIFESDGTLLSTWNCRSSMKGRIHPIGLAVDIDGTIYIADRMSGKVARMRQSLQNQASAVPQQTGDLDPIAGSVADERTGQSDIMGAPMSRQPQPSPTAPIISGGPGWGRGLSMHPADIAIDRVGNLYVADPHNHRIVKFAPEGEPQQSWGDRGLEFPFGITVAADGTVWVTAGMNGRIRRYSSEGQSIDDWGELSHDTNPESGPSSAIDPTGQVYIANSATRQIWRFLPERTAPERWSPGGGHDTCFSDRLSIAVNEDGIIYAVDAESNQVLMFNISGDLLGRWGVPGNDRGQFFCPCGIAIDSAGDVFVSDTGNNRVQKFRADGTFVTQWSSSGSRPGVLWRPGSIAIGPFGNVFVVDLNSGLIEEFKGLGRYRGIDPAGISGEETSPAEIKRYTHQTDHEQLHGEGDCEDIHAEYEQYGVENITDPEEHVLTAAQGEDPVDHQSSLPELTVNQGPTQSLRDGAHLQNNQAPEPLQSPNEYDSDGQVSQKGAVPSGFRIGPVWDSKQRAIINQPPDACILVDAGPGTGKTAVACGRVARLIDYEGLSPSRIWVISFTRVAVQEIRDRIRSYLDHSHGCNGVVIATLDSQAWRIHSGYDGSIRLGSYEDNISGMLRMIQENEDVQEYLRSVEHLIVDEAQDIVGVRADLLLEIFRRLDPACGITVFTDEAQAIFGWAHRRRNCGASGPVMSLAERIRKGESPGFAVRRLHTIHRTRSPGLAKILSGVRKQVMAPASDPGTRFNTVRAEIIQNAHRRYPVLPLEPDSRPGEDSFILHRKNIDAVITSEKLGTIPHRMRFGWGYAGYIQPRLGALLGEFPTPQLSREEFDALWPEAMAGASISAPAPNEAWEMLLRHGRDVDGRHVNLLHLRGRLAVRSPPVEFCRRDIGPAGPVVSTVHASKGREADQVYLNLTPGHWCWNEDIDEETRVLFVGASRARKRLHVIEGGGTAEAAWTTRGRIYTRLGGEGRVRVLLRPDSDITPEGVTGTRYFHDASAVRWSQKRLVGLTDQITACHAWLDSESGEFYHLVPSTVFPEGSNLKENTLTVLGSPVLMADLHEIKKKVTGRDAVVPDRIDQMRMMGVQTIVLPPDAPGLTEIHEPWRTSGFMLAPLLFGYPELQFVSVERWRRRRETDARFDDPSA